MNRDPIPFPRIHAAHCPCAICRAEAWNRNAEARSEPIHLHRQLPNRSAELDRIRNALSPRPSLISRFRAASAPGDLSSIAIGLMLGFLLDAALIVADNGDLIISFFKGLW